MSDKVLKIEDIKHLTNKERNDLRYQCQTDLFFLNDRVLRSSKYPPLLKRVHGGICDSLIQKFPTESAVELLNREFPDFKPPKIVETLKWSPIKERVILSSRGTVKSVLQAGDVVQAVLCDPNIRMMIMSGKLGLAKTSLRLARSYFETNEVLAFLFPQWALNIQINAEEFTTPARFGVNYRDPTIQIGTFGSVKAGSRAEIIILDDATNEINQATTELVEKSIESYDDLDPILEPGGYKTFIGTRWAVDDLPEYIRRNGEEMKAVNGKDHVIYFFQPIWTVKKIEDETLPDFKISQLQAERDEREKNHQLVPEDVELLWPEKINAEYLWPQYRKNYRKFAAQYLLCPESATSGVFTRQLLLRQTRPITECPLPHRSVTLINWDLSGLSGKGDYAFGAVGVWEDTGRLYIIDAVIEKFRSSTDICNAIVRLYKKWYPDYHRIESANGSELISGELRLIAQKAELDDAFIPGWDPPSNTADAKYTRIMLLPGVLENNQLQFFSGIPCLEILYQQFEKFGKKEKGRKVNDDGPDCVAQLYEKWKGAIGPRPISFLTPSEVVVDFQSALPKKESEIDVHAAERMNADLDFLQNQTVQWPDRG